MGQAWQSFVEGFSYLLQLLYGVTVAWHMPSYGLAIILFTVLVKVVLFPLTVSQMRSMRVMQELQPKIKDIQEKFKNKPEKSQEAIMKLYKEAGANPFAGCLPLLIQVPILWALFSSLRTFFNKPGLISSFLWIPNLGQSPGQAGYYAGWFIIPILAAAATFGQQYTISLTTTGGKIDPNQKTMLYTMPLFIGYLASMYPAGLALYWVVFSIAGTIEQLVIKHVVMAGRGQAQRA